MRQRRAVFVAAALIAMVALVCPCGCSEESGGSRDPATKPAAAGGKHVIYDTWPFDAAEASRRQTETASALGIAKDLTLDLGGGVSMKLVLIPAGKFQMGSKFSAPETAKRYGGETDYYENEHPRHKATVTKPFYMGVYEVTRGQFEGFVSATSYKTEAEKEGRAYARDGKSWDAANGTSWRQPGFEQTDSHPVVCVSWNDAGGFCRWLVGKTVRLPTEAEWEYACRAGTMTAYQWGDDPDDGKGWCNGTDQAFKAKSPGWPVFNWSDGYVYTSPVGSFKANAFGLYDMHGNVWEWSQDWYGPYANANVRDPQGPASGKFRVLRGGSWCLNPAGCRSASRFRSASGNRYSRGGFRVVVLLSSGVD